MATTKQIHAAKQNIKKAQTAWQSMTTRQRSLRQPDGQLRKKPGMGNQGEYYRVIIRPKSEFVTFRTHDVGRSGHTQRVAGKRSSGSWATHSWLIHKDDAYVQNDVLKSKNSKIKQILDRLRGTVKRYKGNIFKAKPRKNISESEKPTSQQQRARKKNIQTAQRANQA